MRFTFYPRHCRLANGPVGSVYDLDPYVVQPFETLPDGFRIDQLVFITQQHQYRRLPLPDQMAGPVST